MDDRPALSLPQRLAVLRDHCGDPREAWLPAGSLRPRPGAA